MRQGILLSLDFESLNSYGRMTTWHLFKFSGLVVFQGTDIA